MKSIIRLTVLVSAATAALALAGNALAAPKLSVRQTSTALTIKVSQAQTDAQPAKIVIYVPTGYTINASQAVGTKIGTTSGTVLARDLGISLPLEGNVVVAPPDTNAGPTCATGTHLAVWNLALSVAGQSIDLPVHVDPTTGSETALGAYKLVVCLGPADVPQGAPGRSPNGAQLLDAVFTVNNVFTVPTNQTTWKATTTPYTPGSGAPNVAGTVETRATVAPGVLTVATKVLTGRTVRVSGRLTQAGRPVARAQVSLMIDGKARFRPRTNAAGSYTIMVRRTGGKKATFTFQTRTTIAERDVTSTGCASPTPNVPRGCVSATLSGFTALSRKVRVRV
jgi:hypothetical protein